MFTQVSELFILVPVLLNLKGNLEMNLAARFSTCANMGDLDHPETRNALVWGNLSLIQVQALVSGSIAGLFSVFLGALLHPEDSVTISESVLVIASSMVSASVSSFVLGLFMCVLIIISRMFKIDPGKWMVVGYTQCIDSSAIDNIACPMASSLGDVVTLGILAGCANLLLVNMGKDESKNTIILITVSHFPHLETNLSTFLLLVMFISIPFFGLSVWRNRHVKDLLFSGWTPIIIAMLISSGAGLVLERYVEKFKGLAMITPILCGTVNHYFLIFVRSF